MYLDERCGVDYEYRSVDAVSPSAWFQGYDQGRRAVKYMYVPSSRGDQQAGWSGFAWGGRILRVVSNVFFQWFHGRRIAYRKLTIYALSIKWPAEQHQGGVPELNRSVALPFTPVAAYPDRFSGVVLVRKVFSSASTVVFKTFVCDESAVEGKSYLREDYRLTCESSTHTYFMVYAGFMVLVSWSNYVCATTVGCEHAPLITPPCRLAKCPYPVCKPFPCWFRLSRRMVPSSTQGVSRWHPAAVLLHLVAKPTFTQPKYTGKR